MARQPGFDTLGEPTSLLDGTGGERNFVNLLKKIKTHESLDFHVKAAKW